MVHCHKSTWLLYRPRAGLAATRHGQCRGWFGGTPINAAPQQVAVLSIGLPGVMPHEHRSTGEIVCALSAPSRAMLERFAGLQAGVPVRVSGVPTRWSGLGRDPLLLDRCSLAG